MSTGRLSPQMPARLAEMVKMSARYICTGSVTSPSLKGKVGLAGAKMTSQAAKARSKSWRISVLAFWARE